MYSQPLIPPERIQEARRQWPALDVKDEVFSAHALSQLTARSTTAQLDALHLSDLYLCCACASGVAGAVEVFEQAHAALLTATVHRFSGLAHTSDDLRQIIRQRLFVAEPGLRPKIAEYAGRGPLSAWLRVTWLPVNSRFVLSVTETPPPAFAVLKPITLSFTTGREPP